MATAEQIRQKDQKWANKSWKPFLWMVIGGTIALIVGFILVMMIPVITVGTTSDPATVAGSVMALMIPGIILMVAGDLVTSGGIALMIVTIIKRNKARERLGLPKK